MPTYFVKYVSPKTDKSTNQVIGYTIMVENQKWNYNYSDFFSVEDMKKLYWCNNEKECLALQWKTVLLETIIHIQK